ncbi:Extracellular calcium-sensing receptor [Bagarius yarrelli]|uniref:Extracellular calcium-sensing receptor n=1 Tax=Bagarius yarrelli TaxID=175774 RepID=A0A556TQM3_BAGYA|nr:Extracellular calcium-sensing receptor [Bagarius yarrelli]
MCCQCANKDECVYQGDKGTHYFYQGGDVILGGLFPLHYSPVSAVYSFQSKPEATDYKYFSPRALRWMRTMTFAVTEINQRKDLLPNLTLGYHIRDSCDDIPVSIKSSLILVNGQPEKGSGCVNVTRQPSPVIVGDAASGISMAVLRTLGSFSIPLVSYFASCSCLSNKKEFSTFMRTMPSDEFQIKALAKLVHYFQWTWVGVIGVESDYARFAIQLFLKESIRYNVCPAYVHFYPVTLTTEAVQKLMDVIKASTATVIINFSGESELQTILRECRKQNVTHLQWIASEAWATSQALWSEFHDLLQGTLGFAIRKGEIPNLGGYLKEINASIAQTSSFLAEFWEETFNCRIAGLLNTHIHKQEDQNREACSGRESLDNVYSTFTDVSELRVSYNVYKAVYLIAHALHDMSNCVPGHGPFHNGTCGSLNPLLPWQLISYMRRTNFTSLGEFVHFDENGDPIASYDLMNWQVGDDGLLKLVKVGFYDAALTEDSGLVINEQMIIWRRKNKISYYSTCECLSDKRKYPSFLRTIPSDYYQTLALAEMVKHFGWTWVGAIRRDDDYGNSGMAAFTKIAEQLGICLEYSLPFFRTYSQERVLRIVEQIKSSTSRVIVGFVTPREFEILLYVFSKHNITGYQWVGTEGWIADPVAATLDKYNILQGAVGLAIPKTTVTGLKDFILDVKPLKSVGSAIFIKFWEAFFTCTYTWQNNSGALPMCTGDEKLSEVKNTFTDMSMMPIFSNVYKGVYAIAHTLHDLLGCKQTCPSKRQPDPFTVSEQYFFFLKLLL